MRWLDYFLGRRMWPDVAVRDNIVAGYNFGYKIDASAFPVVRYVNTSTSITSCPDFWDHLPKVGDRHCYRDDMFVTLVDYDCFSATVLYSQGSRVMLPTMEVVWQPPS